MAVLRRLMKVGPAAESLGIYVPALVIHKAVALVRVILFGYLITQVQLGLWGLAAMIFTTGSSIATLGCHQGITRYVSFYEARGTLWGFYRRVRLGLAVLVVAMTGLALVGSGVLTKLLIAPRPGAVTVSYDEQRMVCMAALGNVAILALYQGMLGFMNGMRVYRLVAVLEVVYGLGFAVAAIATLLLWPTALAALLVHLVWAAVIVGAGTFVLQQGLRRLDADGSGGARPARAAESLAVDPVSEADEAAAALPAVPRTQSPAGTIGVEGVFSRVLRFGLANLAGSILWMAVGYVSFWLSSKEYGQASGGVYHMYMRLGQPVLLLANAAWVVGFTHVARRWESGERAWAMQTLQTAYKGAGIALLTLTLILYASSPLWVKLLHPDYHAGLPLLGGILLFYQVVTNLALMNVLAKLRERPIIIAAAALSAGAANVILARAWMPQHGPVGAAWAAGVGIYAGGMAVAVVYFLLARVRLGAATWFVLACPAVVALLAVSPLVVYAVWTVVLAAAVFTRLLFTRQEKAQIAAFLRRLVAIVARRPSP